MLMTDPVVGFVVTIPVVEAIVVELEEQVILKEILVEVTNVESSISVGSLFLDSRLALFHLFVLT